MNLYKQCSYFNKQNSECCKRCVNIILFCFKEECLRLAMIWHLRFMMPQVAVNRGQIKTADTLLMKSRFNRCLERLNRCGLPKTFIYCTWHCTVSGGKRDKSSFVKYLRCLWLFWGHCINTSRGKFTKHLIILPFRS